MSLVDRAVRSAQLVRSLTASALHAAVVTPAALGVRAVAGAASLVPTTLGASRAERERVAARSHRFVDGAFHNTLPAPEPAPTNPLSLAVAMLTRGSLGAPVEPVPLVRPDFPAVADPLAVTWFGHSSALIEIDGRRVLVDPVWSDRASPTGLLGPRRMHPVPTPLAELPRLDAVVISHDHYDHLDSATVRQLLRGGPERFDGQFVVPLGVGAHLRSWGVPAHRVVELDWGGRARIRELTLTCTEARHFSGRALSRDTTLWSSWVITGPQHGVFFGGDTGYTPAFAEIGARFGPFNLTLMPVGAYDERWPDIHMTPEEAVRAHGDLGGGLLVPVHWATFNLAFHGWSDPVRRLLREATRTDTRVAVPRPGERFVVSDPPRADWWSAVDGRGVTPPGPSPTVPEPVDPRPGPLGQFPEPESRG